MTFNIPTHIAGRILLIVKRKLLAGSHTFRASLRHYFFSLHRTNSAQLDIAYSITVSEELREKMFNPVRFMHSKNYAFLLKTSERILNRP